MEWDEVGGWNGVRIFNRVEGWNKVGWGIEWVRVVREKEWEY